MTFPTLTQELADKVRYLKSKGGTSVEIAMITGLPYAVVRELNDGAQWPKTVCRIREDDSWEIIRRP